MQAVQRFAWKSKIKNLLRPCWSTNELRSARKIKVQTEGVLSNQPDFLLVDKHHKRTAVINVVIPDDNNIRNNKHRELGKDLLTEENTEDCMGSDRVVLRHLHSNHFSGYFLHYDNCSMCWSARRGSGSAEYLPQTWLGCEPHFHLQLKVKLGSWHARSRHNLSVCLTVYRLSD